MEVVLVYHSAGVNGCDVKERHRLRGVQDTNTFWKAVVFYETLKGLEVIFPCRKYCNSNNVSAYFTNSPTMKNGCFIFSRHITLRPSLSEMIL